MDEAINHVIEAAMIDGYVIWEKNIKWTLFVFYSNLYMFKSSPGDAYVCASYLPQC